MPPIGYLVPVALLAFCTAVALVAPRPRHTTPSYWSYWVTFQINEQPFVGLYILTAISALAFAQGDLSSPGGLAAFGVYYGRVAGPGSSPGDRVADAPPFLFLHGDNDSSTLVEDTRDFVAKLRAVSGQPVLYGELPGAQHTFDLFYSLRYSYVVDAVTAFCVWLRASRPTGPRAEQAGH